MVLKKLTGSIEMNVRQIFSATALSVAISAPMAAQAIQVDGIDFSTGAILEATTIFEGRVGGGPILAIGEELHGIAIINQIVNSGNGFDWVNGQNGRELTLYFHSYIVQNIFVSGANQVVQYSGGVVEIYSDATPNFSAAGTNAAGIATATDGDLFLRLAGSPIGGFGGGLALTLEGTALGSITGLPAAGLNIAGRGLLDVTGGDAAAFFDTNTFGCTALDGAPCPDDADKSFTSSGQLPVGGFGSWAVRGTAEVQDFSVPELGTLALIGASLFGLGARRRKTA